jgi:very-short-patch-repair endonuclease
MSDFDKFLEIRRIYARVLPKWMADYKATGRQMHDPYLMDWQFTPIEHSVWQDIRCAGLPFFPQMPVLNYFLDFGNPFLKIGIECDGKQWHDKDRDAIRDARLSAEGWEIYRIPGHECKRTVGMENLSDQSERPSVGELSRYYMDTSEGLIDAIKFQYFGGDIPYHSHLAAKSTLVKHQTARGHL